MTSLVVPRAGQRSGLSWLRQSCRLCPTWQALLLRVLHAGHSAYHCPHFQLHSQQHRLNVAREEGEEWEELEKLEREEGSKNRRRNERREKKKKYLSIAAQSVLLAGFRPGPGLDSWAWRGGKGGGGRDKERKLCPGDRHRLPSINLRTDLHPHTSHPRLCSVAHL